MILQREVDRPDAERRTRDQQPFGLVALELIEPAIDPPDRAGRHHDRVGRPPLERARQQQHERDEAENIYQHQEADQPAHDHCTSLNRRSTAIRAATVATSANAPGNAASSSQSRWPRPAPRAAPPRWSPPPSAARAPAPRRSSSA